ncbi:MAG: DUF2948 family protein [Rhodobacteraceae bacterium]|nr:DUF2948 family protein [Paracoccaceae bacterium]
MAEDAKFEDGDERPLNLGALDGEDLRVLATLTQDAVLPVTEMSFKPRERRFALLLNRFRWEHQTGRGAPERVQSLLVFENVLKVTSQGIDRSDKDMILSLLDIEFDGADDDAGNVTLVLAGDGAIRLEVEALEASLRDVTRPYLAPSKSAPHHNA